MKNFEKYKDKILELTIDGDSFGCTNEGVLQCAMIDCHACIFRANQEDKRGCSVKKIEWLYEAYVEKPKLNKSERAFCEMLQTGWIARDKNNQLYLYTTAMPIKSSTEWRAVGEYCILDTLKNCNSDLTFKFVKWEDEEPWSVKDLLELKV